MIEFNGSMISMTRGDTLVIDTVIYTANDKIYEIAKGDEVFFDVKKDDKVYIHKNFQTDANGMLVIALEHDDTAYLSKGEYRYSCTLRNILDGKVRIQETYSMGNLLIK